MTDILIVEDEDRIRMALEDDLTLEGYAVTGERDGTRALERARGSSFDLIILDLMLPGLDGLEICKRLRAEGDLTPILMLTAKSQEVDKVLGLELGADDYVTKPFSPRELLARIKALLRRHRPATDSPTSASFGDVEIDFKGYTVTKAGAPVELTAREFDLLRFLLSHPGEVLDRGSILEEVWGDDWDIFPRTIDTHVVHLRRKLEDEPATPRFIVNVRGVGYKFVPDPP
ncbi:MAG: response regulator transcription factor [Gemmatimonadetes bacterium]|nr:response regulator transcription factor [Gemmatimonadota bacterium]